MDAFDLKDDTSLYFLAWANQEGLYKPFF